MEWDGFLFIVDVFLFYVSVTERKVENIRLNHYTHFFEFLNFEISNFEFLNFE